MPERPLHLKAMCGLGDGIYARPLIRHLLSSRGPLWLSTPYAELYSDLTGVSFVRPAVGALRCQRKNVEAQPAGTWTLPPSPKCERVQIEYALQAGETGVIAEMERRAGVRIQNFSFDLPQFESGFLEAYGRYAVVRPVSLRREWTGSARNPDPTYLSEAARELRRQGLEVICVGDLEPPAEVLQGELPEADLYLTRGELTIPQLFGLISRATLVLGGTGWIVPACLAHRTPAVILGGGLGQHNAPSLLTDPRMGDRPIRWVLPEPYCMCRNPRHECSKTIPDFLPKLRAAIAEVLA